VLHTPSDTCQKWWFWFYLFLILYTKCWSIV